MATMSKGRPNYRFLPAVERDSLTDSVFEFDESELFNSARANSPEFRNSIRTSRFHGSSSSSSGGGRSGAPSSLPVNVPDWSKILGDEYRQSRRRNNHHHDEDDGDDDDGEEFHGGGRVPPHEFLARNRMASLSVHEGIGRTLKGRDLSRVRNAVWAKTGFQD
ncbi:protein S40-4-like [Lotus japonicus]|uniref:protein S40-4-like n=1 Tax=Lotus japonicus TaxID=34305 RepID=UPI0025839676|nr:protein S40-4-like [Lotus japonicus]